MSKLKTLSNENDLYVFLAFHIPDDSDSQLHINNITNIMNQYFQDSTFKTIDPEFSESYEMIYKIQKPLVASNEDVLSFFENLRTVFRTTDRFTPHFTQVH